MAPFASPPRRRRRSTHLTQRDLGIFEALVGRKVETLEYLHREHFAEVSRKRALNRLGELIAGGYLERTQVHLPGQSQPSSVYWLTTRARRAIEIRANGATWFSTRTWRLEPDSPSIPHQIVTNRVCDWLGVQPVPEHLQPRLETRCGDPLRHRPDAYYEARDADTLGRRLVLLEVDLGHYSRKRLLEKVGAFRQVRDARYLIVACPTNSRCNQVAAAIRERFGPDFWERATVMSFDEIHRGVPPGMGHNPQDLTQAPLAVDASPVDLR